MEHYTNKMDNNRYHLLLLNFTKLKVCNQEIKISLFWKYTYYVAWNEPFEKIFCLSDNILLKRITQVYLFIDDTV